MAAIKSINNDAPGSIIFFIVVSVCCYKNTVFFKWFIYNIFFLTLFFVDYSFVI